MRTGGMDRPLSPPGLIANLIDSAIDPSIIFHHQLTTHNYQLNKHPRPHPHTIYNHESSPKCPPPPSPTGNTPSSAPPCKPTSSPSAPTPSNPTASHPTSSTAASFRNPKRSAPCHPPTRMRSTNTAPPIRNSNSTYYSAPHTKASHSARPQLQN